jgi:hypothetical protein
MRLTTALILCVLAVGFTPATLRAQDAPALTFDDATLAATPAFQGRGGARAAREPHEFGLGVRTGSFGVGLGVTVRSWFDAPWGVQAGLAQYGHGDVFDAHFSSTEFSAAVLYEFNRITFDAPLTLRPYVGGGVSVLHSSFPHLKNTDTTDTGVLVLGGVEIFFSRVPKLGVSGELEFRPSSTPFSGVNDVGGPGFVALAHWYFK